jgi:hypothetical protein
MSTRSSTALGCSEPEVKGESLPAVGAQRSGMRVSAARTRRRCGRQRLADPAHGLTVDAHCPADRNVDLAPKRRLDEAVRNHAGL